MDRDVQQSAIILGSFLVIGVLWFGIHMSQLQTKEHTTLVDSQSGKVQQCESQYSNELQLAEAESGNPGTSIAGASMYKTIVGEIQTCEQQ